MFGEQSEQDQELERMIHELEEWIYSDSLYIAAINSDHLNYLEMLQDASETMRIYIELQQQDNEEADGQGQDQSGQQPSDEDKQKQQQKKQDQKEKLQEFLKKRAQKQNGEEESSDEQQKEEGNEDTNEGEIPEDPHDERPPEQRIIHDAPPGVCQELWELVGEENYRKLEKRMAVNSTCHVKRDKVPGMTYYYKIGTTRRSTPALPVKVNGKILRVAFCPELREVVVGE